MPLFKYTAKQAPDRTIEKIIEAASKEDALEKISKNGLYPLKIEEATASQEKIPSGETNNLKIRSREITTFSRQFSILLKSGVPMLSSLNILKNQSRDKQYKQMLIDIHEKVKNGVDLSKSLTAYPRVFSSFYIAMVQAGESSGALHQVLSRISDYRKRMEEIFSHIRAALAYPILIALVGAGTVIYMLTSVMPKLLKVFSDLGQQLPVSTKILINLSKFLRQWWLWVVVIICGLLLLANQFLKTKSGKRFWSVFKIKLPFFGKFLVKVELMRFARTLEILIRSGIPILKAIKVTVPVLQNELIKEKVTAGKKILQEGGSFTKSLEVSGFFPEFMINLLLVGEESGRLAESLAEIGNTYERETEETIKTMISLIEPVLILIMGVVVGFIVFSMLFPLFQITAGIG